MRERRSSPRLPQRGLPHLGSRLQRQPAIQLTRKTVKRHSPAALDRLHLVQSDACDANFPPASFDCVITTDFVEHVLQDRLVLVVQEGAVLLKPGGRFVVHTSPTLGYMYFGQFVARSLGSFRVAVRNESRRSPASFATAVTATSSRCERCAGCCARSRAAGLGGVQRPWRIP